MIAFVLYLDQFFAPIQQLSQVFDTWQQAAASMERIDELMATPTGTPRAGAPGRAAAGCGARSAFEGVHFRYPGTVGDEALAGVDLHIAAGETVALVGETGAGKSTIVKLVARFYDPTAGRVTVDGVDLRDLDLPRLPAPARRRAPGGVPVHGHAPRQHRLRPARRHRRRGRGGGPGRGRPRRSSPPCPTAT